MENYFNYFKKSFPIGGVDPPSRTQSYPAYSTQKETNQGGLNDWTNFSGSSDYSTDLQQLCLPTGSIARRRRHRDIVEKFSALTLNDTGRESDEDDYEYRDYHLQRQRTRMDPIMPQINNNTNAAWFLSTTSNPVPKKMTYESESSWFSGQGMGMGHGQVPQIHHNIFQTKVTTNSIMARSLARVVSVNEGCSTSSAPEVIHVNDTSELERKRSLKWYIGLLLWILAILGLVGLLNAPDNNGSICWNKDGAGLLMVTVAANVSEWDGIWKASFTVRSDNNLTLYILLVGAIVGFLRQIFDK